MKRTLIFFLVISLSVTFMAGTVSGEEQTTLQIMAFEGGFGTDWLEEIASEYEESNPDVNIEITASPRIWEQFRPKLLAGNPPDLASPGWGFDLWSAIAEGKVMPLTEAYNESAYNKDEKWKNTFREGSLNSGYFEGNYYTFPLFFDIDGWYYEESTFEEKGFQVPETLAELKELGKKAKEQDISLFSNQGTYPYYAIWNHFYMYAVRIGGPQVFEDAMNLEKGAWENPAFKKAAELMVQFNEKGYFQKGHLGMNHTQAQMEVVVGRALINGAGSWLPNEMAEATPEDKQLMFMPIPKFPQGKGNGAIAASDNSATNWIVPAEADHPELAVDFLKYMTTLENTKLITRKANGITTIKGSEEAINKPGVTSALKAYKKADTVVNVESTMFSWYPKLEEKLENNITSLFQNKITPEELCKSMEEAASELRKDDSIIKHDYEVIEK